MINHLLFFSNFMIYEAVFENPGLGGWWGQFYKYMGPVDQNIVCLTKASEVHQAVVWI